MLVSFLIQKKTLLLLPFHLLFVSFQSLVFKSCNQDRKSKGTSVTLPIKKDSLPFNLPLILLSRTGINWLWLSFLPRSHVPKEKKRKRTLVSFANQKKIPFPLPFYLNFRVRYPKSQIPNISKSKRHLWT